MGTAKKKQRKESVGSAAGHSSLHCAVRSAGGFPLSPVCGDLLCRLLHGCDRPSIGSSSAAAVAEMSDGLLIADIAFRRGAGNHVDSRVVTLVAASQRHKRSSLQPISSSDAAQRHPIDCAHSGWMHRRAMNWAPCSQMRLFGAEIASAPSCGAPASGPRSERCGKAGAAAAAAAAAALRAALATVLSLRRTSLLPGCCRDMRFLKSCWLRIAVKSAREAHLIFAASLSHSHSPLFLSVATVPSQLQPCSKGQQTCTALTSAVEFSELWLIHLSCCCGRVCFLRFSNSESVSGSSLAKSSVARNIKKSICESYPALDSTDDSKDGPLDAILGDKKQPLHVIKCHDRVGLVVINKSPKFFQVHEKEQWVPLLRLLHQYPDLLPVVQVDRGAIKFVLKGADIMAPGLTSAGGALGNTTMESGTYVAVKAEGKEQILAIGRLTMSTKDIRAINKGTAIENLHFLNDGLWNTASIE